MIQTELVADVGFVARARREWQPCFEFGAGPEAMQTTPPDELSGCCPKR